MSYPLCQKFKQKCFPTQVPLQANGKAPSLPANQSTLCLLTQNTPLTNHNAGFSKWTTTCNIEICCVTSWERNCNAGNNAFQLAMQQCCATSRAKMLPVLLDLNWNQYKIWDMDVHGWSLLHYSHFDTSTCASAKEILPLLSFALAGLPFQFKVQTTDMNFLNLIPYIGIHIKLALTQGIYICRILFYPKDFFHSWI